jgi:hypothetical protein
VTKTRALAQANNLVGCDVNTVSSGFPPAAPVGRWRVAWIAIGIRLVLITPLGIHGCRRAGPRKQDIRRRIWVNGARINWLAIGISPCPSWHHRLPCVRVRKGDGCAGRIGGGLAVRNRKRGTKVEKIVPVPIGIGWDRGRRWTKPWSIRVKRRAGL